MDGADIDKLIRTRREEPLKKSLNQEMKDEK